MELLRKLTGKTLIEGHRGAEGLGIENSWQAIERGFSAGADILELDVQFSRDGQLVLFNDYILPDGNWIRDLDRFALKKVRVKEQPLVFLEDVLEWVKDKKIVLSLDIKNGFGFEREIFQKTITIVERENLIDQVIFLGWDNEGLLGLRQHNPDVTTKALIRGYPVNFVEVVQAAQVDAINLSADLTSLEIVQAFQNAGIAVFLGMTFRPDYSLVNKWRLDGISCSDPAVARQAIKALSAS